jgi:hypothetical protein
MYELLGKLTIFVLFLLLLHNILLVFPDHALHAPSPQSLVPLIKLYFLSDQTLN